MSDCILCDMGVKLTTHIRLVDPTTGLPNGQTLVVGQDSAFLNLLEKVGKRDNEVLVDLTGELSKNHMQRLIDDLRAMELTVAEPTDDGPYSYEPIQKTQAKQRATAFLGRKKGRWA